MGGEGRRGWEGAFRSEEEACRWQSTCHRKEESDGTDRLAARKHLGGGSQEVGAPRGCWEIPAMPLTSSGLKSCRGATTGKEGGGATL